MAVDRTELREHLVASRLAGEVDTPPASALANCERLVAGNPVYTFGLSDWRTADRDEAVGAVRAHCGPPAVESDPAGPGWIDPGATLEGIERHRRALRRAAEAGADVLLVTGHPTGLLVHYQRIAERLSAAGCGLLTPRDDERFLRTDAGRRLGVRFLGGVGCVWSGGDLLHRHRSDIMEGLLDTLEERGEGPDLVIGDHGAAGAAVERGIATLSIADVNDPALLLAETRGRTDGVLVIDDNLAPRLFEPVTDAMLAGMRV